MVCKSTSLCKRLKVMFSTGGIWISTKTVNNNIHEKALILKYKKTSTSLFLLIIDLSSKPN